MPGANLADVRVRLAGFAAEIERLQGEIDAALARDAEAHIRAITLDSLAELTDGVVLLEGERSYRRWRERFVELPIARQREIVRALVTVTVGEKGRGASRLQFGSPGVA